MYISNASGTGNDRPSCQCASWEQHWRKNTKHKSALYCFRTGCYNMIAVGAHVFKKGGFVERIVGLCHECNRRGGYFAVPDGTELADPYRCW